MTKLEAWKKWCEEAHVTDAAEYTQAFSAGWDAAVDKYAKIFDSHEKTTALSKVERIAMWMSVNNYATGHGDTVEDLLKELEWQITERERAAIKGFKTIEEAQRLLANVGDEYVICKVVSSQYDFDGEVLAYFVMHKDADPIHARGKEGGLI